MLRLRNPINSLKSIASFSSFRAKGNVQFSWPVPRQLREVVKMSAIQREDALAIKYMWTEQFKANPRVCTNSMLESDHQKTDANMKRASMFLCPLHINNGVINLLVQCQDSRHILLTSVEQFRADSMNAPPYAIVTCFDELLDAKGVALWRIDGISLDINRNQLFFLLKYVQACYQDPNLFLWVERFNHAPRSFSYEEFISSCGQSIANIRQEADKELSEIDSNLTVDPRLMRSDLDKPLRMHDKPKEEFKDWF